MADDHSITSSSRNAGLIDLQHLRFAGRESVLQHSLLFAEDYSTDIRRLGQ
jgi:hypothetical protein